MFGFSVRRICCCARIRNTLYTRARSSKLLRTRRGDERNAGGKGGRGGGGETEGEEIYDPPCTTPAVTFLVLLFRARDGLLSPPL